MSPKSPISDSLHSVKWPLYSFKSIEWVFFERRFASSSVGHFDFPDSGRFFNSFNFLKSMTSLLLLLPDRDLPVVVLDDFHRDFYGLDFVPEFPSVFVVVDVDVELRFVIAFQPGESFFR